MSDSLTLYRTRVTMIINTRVHIHDVRCLITIAWAIVVVLLERSVHLSKWGIHRASKPKTASKQMQFGRWLKNAQIGHTTIYPNLVKVVFAEWEVIRFTWHWIVVACEKYSQILKDVAAILSKGCPVILLADRGFDDNDLFCAMRDLGWGFRLQMKKSLRVYRVSKPCLSVGAGSAMLLLTLTTCFLSFGLNLGLTLFPA